MPQGGNYDQVHCTSTCQECLQMLFLNIYTCSQYLHHFSFSKRGVALTTHAIPLPCSRHMYIDKVGSSLSLHVGSLIGQSQPPTKIHFPGIRLSTHGDLTFMQPAKLYRSCLNSLTLM